MSTHQENETFPKQVLSHLVPSATIKAKGMLIGKVAAEVSWNGKAHVLKKKGGMLCTVKVNDTFVSEHTLTINDRIVVGSSSFQYVLYSDK